MSIKTKPIYIILYKNPGNYEKYGCVDKRLFYAQANILNSDYVHIVIGRDSESNEVDAYTGRPADCIFYEVSKPRNGQCGPRKENETFQQYQTRKAYMERIMEETTGKVIKHTKEARVGKYCNKITIHVPVDKFNKVFEFLDELVDTEAPFNYWGYLCNLLPFCPFSFSNDKYYCAQLIADALVEGGLIDLSRYVETDGYTYNSWITAFFDCCCCCCFWRKPKLKSVKKKRKVKIPPSHKMPVKLLWDVINQQCRYLDLTVGSTKTNINQDVRRNKKERMKHKQQQKRKKKKKKRKRKKKKRTEEEQIFLFQQNLCTEINKHKKK